MHCFCSLLCWFALDLDICVVCFVCLVIGGFDFVFWYFLYLLVLFNVVGFVSLWLRLVDFVCLLDC